MHPTIYTIGHSNYKITYFIELLGQHNITAICDVRSQPYSRYAPQYSRDALKKELNAAGITYVFLGKELGARSKNPACYRNGKIQYELLAKEPIFLEGIDRVVQGSNQYRIALMCAEKDPINCHRTLLVSRKLFEKGFPINHILPDGSLETHKMSESRLLAICKLPEGDMFKSREEFIKEAYRIHGGHVAYQDENSDNSETE